MLSVGTNAQNLEDSLKFSITEKGDFDRAFALFILQLHSGSKPFSQAVFEIGDLGIRRRRARGGRCRGRTAFAGLKPGHQGLRLADVEPLALDTLGGEPLLLLGGKTEDNLGLAHREAAIPDPVLEVRRQFQKPQGICHNRAAFADF